MTEGVKEADDNKPPFFDSWNKMYAMVMGVLALFILLFYLFTITYS